MGEPLDSTRQSRFGQDALRNEGRFLRDMREIEDAILLLQDKVDSLQSTNTQLEARVSALETEVQNQLELIQSLQQDG